MTNLTFAGGRRAHARIAAVEELQQSGADRDAGCDDEIPADRRESGSISRLPGSLVPPPHPGDDEGGFTD